MRRIGFNGVEYALDWMSHLSTGIELPLLPGAVYVANSFPELTQRIGLLFTENLIITDSGTSHPELLNSLFEFGDQVYPVLVKEFLTRNSKTRGSAAFWHAELSKKRLEFDELPSSMPSAEVFAVALSETDSTVRALAAATFGGFLEHSTPYLESLIPLLADAECCEIVLEALGQLGGCANAALPDIILVGLRHHDAKTRCLAVKTIEMMSRTGFVGHMPQDVKFEAIPLLLSLIISDEPYFRKIAARCLGLLGTGPDVRAALANNIADPDASVCETATWALNRLPGNGALIPRPNLRQP